MDDKDKTNSVSQNYESDDDDEVQEFEYSDDDSSEYSSSVSEFSDEPDSEDDGVMASPDLFSEDSSASSDTESDFNPFDKKNVQSYKEFDNVVSNTTEISENSDSDVSEEEKTVFNQGIQEAAVDNSNSNENSETSLGSNPDNPVDDTISSFEEHRKMSASDADNDRPVAKPRKVNKKFILTVVISVFCLTFVLVFLLPDKYKNKNGDEKKPAVENGTLMDFSKYAKTYSEEAKSFFEQKKNTDSEINDKNSSKKKDDVEIPPVIPPGANVDYRTGGYYYPSSKSSNIEVPDTRNDSLQAKSISGIKGLTSSQQKYTTDYQNQIKKNAASTQTTSYALQMPSKDEFMKSAMAGLNSQDSYRNQNDQAGKNEFYNSNKDNAGQGEWLDLNTIWQGTIFEAILTSAINTDLPGEITARVAKNIYSSQDGRYLLIPQNSILYGTYNSSISYAQSRIQVQWNYLTRPDGYRINLGGMNGTDPTGASGLKGFVNDHPMGYLKAIALMSVVSISNAEFSAALADSNNDYIKSLIANSQQVSNELGDKLIDRAMNVQPTIKIKEGTKINIVVNNTLSLPPCEDVPVTQAYHKY